MLKGRKGSVFDFLLIGIIVFIAVVFLIVSSKVHFAVKQTGIMNLSQESKVIQQSTETAILSGDNLMLFVIVGLSIFVLISASMVWNHPALFIASIFLLAIFLVIFANVSNAFETFSSTSAIQEEISRFPKTQFLMSKLPLYVLFMGIATVIIMYVSRT